MTRKNKPKKSKRKEYLTTNKHKIYFDACALETKYIYENFYSNYKHGQRFFVSHLSLGEALGNCKNPEQRQYFLDLFNNLIDNFELKVIETDNCDKIFYNLRNRFNRLSITDALHLATAISNKFNEFYTRDGDFSFNTKLFNDFLKENNYFKIKIHKI